MIHIVEGVPGSGKTYYAVNYLVSNFFEYDSFYSEYKERPDKNVLVITNIDSLRLKHLNLDYLIERFTLEKFFTVENFEKIQKQYRVKNIVVIVDEAQKYFDRKFYNKDVFYFFQYHRHLGVDIFLLTQSKNTLARELVVLSEYIIKAVPRSLQYGSFRYKFYDVNGNHLFTKSLKRDNNVFRAYKSFDVKEVSKPKNVLLPKIVFASVSIFVSLALVFFLLRFFWYSPSKSPPSPSASSVPRVKSDLSSVPKPKPVRFSRVRSNPYPSRFHFRERYRYLIADIPFICISDSCYVLPPPSHSDSEEEKENSDLRNAKH